MALARVKGGKVAASDSGRRAALGVKKKLAMKLPAARQNGIKRPAERGAVTNGLIIKGRQVARMSEAEIRALDSELLQEANDLSKKKSSFTTSIGRSSPEFRSVETRHRDAVADLRKLRESPHFRSTPPEMTSIRSNWGVLRRKLANL